MVFLCLKVGEGMFKWLNKLLRWNKTCNHEWKYAELKDNHRRTLLKRKECKKCGEIEYLNAN